MASFAPLPILAREGKRAPGPDEHSLAARPGALEEQRALAFIARQRGRALQLRARLIIAAQLEEQVAAHARQEVVAIERWLRGQRLDEVEAGLRAEGHGDRHRAVQLDDGGRRDPGELGVEPRDAHPVRLRRGQRSGVTGGDRGLERVRPGRAAELPGALERGQAETDEELVPEGTVLVEEQNWLARR